MFTCAAAIYLVVEYVFSTIVVVVLVYSTHVLVLTDDTLFYLLLP